MLPWDPDMPVQPQDPKHLLALTPSDPLLLLPLPLLEPLSPRPDSDEELPGSTLTPPPHPQHITDAS